MFFKQFIGARTPTFFITIAAVHLVAVLVNDSVWSLVALLVIGALTMWVAWRDLPLALALAFVELFVGGHGHLIDAPVFGFSLSLRMVIFAAVMIVWSVRFLKKNMRPSLVPFRDGPWVLLTGAVVLGTMIGFLRNDPRQAFDDMNGFLTIAYVLPLISLEWSNERKYLLLQALFAAAAWMTGLTLVLSYVFTHVDGDTLHVVYRFVRDQRLAEITLQTMTNSAGEIVQPYAVYVFGRDGYFYRIFMQSQVSVCALLLLVWAGMLSLWRDQRLPAAVSALFVFCASAILLSLSRSFLLGMVVAAVWVLVLSLFVGKKAIQNGVKRTVLVTVLLVAAGGIAWISAAIPLPHQPNLSTASFYETSADAGRDLALSSRWELLGPLMEAIWLQPIAGAGFGAEVTYITNDPRIRSEIPSGEYTTYRFEWGYQDLWLKMGIFGLLAIVWYYAAVFQAMHVTVRRHGHKWIVIGLSGGLVMLAVANVFSPYFNHPIGLGFLLFVLPFIDFDLRKEPEKKEELTPLLFKESVKQMAGVVQSVEEE